MFTIKNTGDVPLVDVKLTDKTVKGSGHIQDIKCPDSLAKGLKVGEEVTCQGNLSGVKPGETHTDIATVTGKSFYSGKQVSASDPWNGKGVAKGGGLAKTGATSMLALFACLMLATAGSGLTLPTDKSGGFLLQRDCLARRQVLHLLHKRYGKRFCRGSRVSLGTV